MRTIKKIFIFLIVAGLFYGSYDTWKSYSEQKGLEEGKSIDVPINPVKESADGVDGGNGTGEQVQIPSGSERDNQRKLDLAEIARAIEEYAKFNKGEYPVTVGYEKISDKNNVLNQILRRDGYLTKEYADPSSGASFYGYKSDGKSYELTAVLENKNDISCMNIGNYCIYILKKP